MDLVKSSVDILSSLDWQSGLAMFWFMALLEIPRYTFSFLVIAGNTFVSRLRPPPALTRVQQMRLDGLKVSVVIAGHNEAGAMRACIRSLAEQSRRIDEIICVDDGSTDGMREVLAELRREGLIHVALCNQDRCGKVAAANLAMLRASGDIVVNLDADCSYDRDAIELLIRPFLDPKVGATCGAIGVRNPTASIIASYQAIEYVISIGLGKRVQDYFNLVMCVSGAFGAFRREVIHQIGCNEPGPGEDFDMTLRIRRAGWTVRFAADAWCFTDGLPTLQGLIRQRRRWDRDTVRTRLRKFRGSFAPRRGLWRPLETLEQIEFLLMNLLGTLAFPFYIGWMLYVFGSGVLALLGAVAVVYIAIDVLGFLLAVYVTRRFDARMVLQLLPFLLTSGLFNGVFMRLVRLYAYFEEWVFRASMKDRYVPTRVQHAAPLF